jgi:hypothetical protein
MPTISASNTALGEVWASSQTLSPPLVGAQSGQTRISSKKMGSSGWAGLAYQSSGLLEMLSHFFGELICAMSLVRSVSGLPWQRNMFFRM